jgi:hypothetical protein
VGVGDVQRRDPDGAVRFVDVADRLEQRVGLGEAGAVDQAA